MLERIAILGLGLMGSSLGMAVKQAFPECRRIGYARRQESRSKALDLDIVDEVTEWPESAVKDCDLAVACVPVLAIPDILGSAVPGLRTDAVVTDVGSTKVELVRQITEVMGELAPRFVGSHPIAGSEMAGMESARADIYRDARTVVTPAGTTAADALQQVEDFWRELGCKVSVMSPADHDGIIARTSHLPHLAAAALVQSVCRDGEGIAPFCGGGFMDTTRVAAGSEELWHDIVKTNRSYMKQELDLFGRTLATLAELVENGEFERVRGFLARSREQRRRIGEAVSGDSAA